jgi:NADH:ubiquinone oxidoreductase subunit 2 (subunit N)
MAAVAKTGGFAALLRVFVSSFPTVRADWQPIIWVLAVITLLLGAAVGVVQRDVKRMLAYSSINHAGFILLGLYLVTVRGVSSSLYYLFTYTFMVMGSFAVITVVGGLGDTDHDLDTYRGLARRQPWLAVPMIIFLLAQAGLPATTGLWAKVYVIEGVVGTPGGDALAVIAMLSAVVAAFFYLRLVLYMVAGPTPAPGSENVGDPMPALVGATASTSSSSSPSSSSSSASPSSSPSQSPGSAYGSAPESGPDLVAQSGVVATLETDPGADTAANADAGVTSEDADSQSVVPLSIATAIAICAGFTVLFGVWPSPIVNFAHAATLLLH